MFQKYCVRLSIFLLALMMVSCSNSCNPSPEITKSKEFLDAGMFDQAVILLKQEVQSNPKNAQAHMLLGVAYYGQGTYPTAEQELNTAFVMEMSLRPEASKRLYGIAKLLVKTDKSKAGTLLKKAKEFDSSLEKDEEFFFLTNIDTEQNPANKMNAAKSYLTLFPAGANTAQAIYEVAEGLLKSGDSVQAKTYFTQVATQFPATEWGKKSNEHLSSLAEKSKKIDPFAPPNGQEENPYLKKPKASNSQEENPYLKKKDPFQ